LVEYPALLWTRPNWAPRILCMLLIRGLRQCSDKVLAIIVHLTHTHSALTCIVSTLHKRLNFYTYNTARFHHLSSLR